MGQKTYTELPTTAYVAYHIPCRFEAGGGTNGAARSKRDMVILTKTAGIQALYGRSKSERVYRSHTKPTDRASAKNCAGYPSTSRMKEYTSFEGGRTMTKMEGI